MSKKPLNQLKRTALYNRLQNVLAQSSHISQNNRRSPEVSNFESCESDCFVERENISEENNTFSYNQEVTINDASIHVENDNFQYSGHEYFEESENRDEEDICNEWNEENTINDANTYEENDHNIDANEYLYDGATLTVGQSMLLILSLLIKHNVTLSCIGEITEIINLHCPQKGLKKNSLFKFKKFFAFVKEDIVKHYYCNICNRSLVSENEVCPSCPRTKKSYFITMPLIKQLRELFKRKGFYDILQYRFRRETKRNVISDVYDGSIYKFWVNNGFLSNPHNISFSWYTDGVPVFKSSKISMWPFFLTINELPFKMRKLKQNTLLIGLWFGDKKPNPNLFMLQFKDELLKIAEGVKVTIHENIEIIVKGILLFGTADTPAKSEFLNFTQFNGAYGCSTCFIKGENIKTLKGSVHVYTYLENMSMRTLENCVKWANTADNNPMMGIKGPSTLSILMPDYVKGAAIDRMHAIEGGIVKKILTLFFDIEYRTEPFSLYQVRDSINQRLMAIKPPKFIHRMARSTQDLVHWKASELKMWAFYYSLPILEGILPQEYFNNYKLLIIATAILSFDEIALNLIDIAEDFLHKFVKDFEHLYGIRFCSINIHQALHLPDCVRKFGPLWATTAYEYENINGQLLKMIHGTNHIDCQIAKSHVRSIKMQRLVDQLPDGEIRNFCLNKKKQVKIIEEICINCYTVGTYKALNPVPNTLARIIFSTLHIYNFKVYKYFRLLKDSILFVSKMYPRHLKTTSYAIQIKANGELQLGLILYFIKISNCNCAQQSCKCIGDHYALIQKVSTVDVFAVSGYRFNYNSINFLHECHAEINNYTLIPVQNIFKLCILLNIEDKMYIGITMNEYELE
ncbi:uncharacterized protein [Prorops nasuta]|uniref:uncharacterized protein n=1 Tax=Prorops nasuta TaxID=863751 RepID=UPI0034D019DD